jgi:hypothetical protein
MGIFDKLIGTRHPEEGIVPRSAEEVREALLGVSRPDAPYVVRNGAQDDADLVAEWRMSEPAWQAIFIESQMSRVVRIRMRLVHEKREVRALEEGWEVMRVGNPPKLKIGGSYSRGPDRTVSRHYTIRREDSGSLEATETFRFDGAELREPLQNAVLKAGWTWRGVVFGKV